MKVLWLGHNLAYPPKGGALQRNYNLLRQAAGKAEVHFLGFDQPKTRPPNVGPEDCIEALMEFCASADSVPLAQNSIGGHRYIQALRALVSENPYEVHWLKDRRMTAKLQDLLERIPFDVIHFDTLGLAQYIPLLRPSSGMVLNHHDVQSALMTRRMCNEANPLLKLFWGIEARKLRRTETLWGKAVGMNLVCSDDEAKVLVGSDFSMRAAVVANGVDTEYFSVRSDPEGEVLLFCGSLDMYPNQEAMKFFFDAIWPGLSARRRRAEIHVVGRQPPDWLQRIGKTDRRIQVTGFVDDVRPYFEKASICVCPIREGGGTRLKILDSLAMGVPVIGTSFACSGLDLKHERDVLVADTPDEFIHQTERLLDSAVLRAGLTAAGRKLVEHTYSWHVVGKHLLAAYERAFSVKGQPRCDLGRTLCAE